MATSHLIDTHRLRLDQCGSSLGPLRACYGSLGTPVTMETNDVVSAIEPAMTLPELAAYLSVSTQALYDLRSQGRGPRGFRVGRQLRFRDSEIQAWLARMEVADGERHQRPAGL